MKRHSTGPNVLYSLVALLLAVSLPVAWLASYGGGNQAAAEGVAVSPASGRPQSGAAPLLFEPNAGQTDPSVRFVVHTGTSTIFFTRSEVVLGLAYPGTPDAPSTALERLRFVNPSSSTTISTGSPASARVNYLLGNKPDGWHTDLPTYSSITYQRLFPGVDLTYTGAGGQLKGTYSVTAGADPSRIRWQYEGSHVSLDEAGNLHVQIAGAAGKELVEQAPVAWQERDGRRTPVTASFALSPDDTASFRLGQYDMTAPLTIDPTLTFSSFLGGTAASGEAGNGIAADAGGNFYAAGYTYSSDFPVVNARQPVRAGPPDAFVTKFNPDGTVAYSTFLGGNGEDNAASIRVDATGSVYVAGRTYSSDFPTHNAYHTTLQGGEDAFLTRLSPDGQTLLYSTYFGGTSTDFAWGVAIDSAGNAYLAGNTTTGLPTRNAFQASPGGATDAFLARLNTNLSGDASLIYSSYFGGSGVDTGGGGTNTEVGHGVAADDAGNAYITGQTMSSNFPTRNAFQPAWGANGNPDAYLARFNTNASGDASLIYSTYLGGAGGDAGHDVAADAAGNAYLTGSTGGVDLFPTRNRYDRCVAGPGPFVSKLNTNLSGDPSLVYSTCFGAGGGGTGNSIAIDDSGDAYITGDTTSSIFPQVQPVHGFGGGHDAFALELGAPGNTLLFSSYLGGAASDSGYGVAYGGNNIYLTGVTVSSDFPTANPYQPSLHGISDAFVSRIDLSPPSTPVASSTSTSTSTSTPSPTATAPPAATSTPTGPPTFTPTAPPAASGTPTRRPTFTQAPTFTPPPTNSPTSTATPGGPSPTPCTPSFSDVSPGDYFYPHVAWLYCHGAISGYADGSFRPYNNTTRAQLVKIVVLAENWVLVAPPSPHFSDVPADNVFYPYIETAVQHEAISGYADGTFRPYNNVTRGQVCKIVCIAQRWPLIDPIDPHFVDVGVDNPFYVFVETVYSHNVISGYNDGTFRPGANATRGQLSKIVVNAITQP